MGQARGRAGELLEEGPSAARGGDDDALAVLELAGGVERKREHLILVVIVKVDDGALEVLVGGVGGSGSGWCVGASWRLLRLKLLHSAQQFSYDLLVSSSIVGWFFALARGGSGGGSGCGSGFVGGVVGGLHRRCGAFPLVAARCIVGTFLCALSCSCPLLLLLAASFVVRGVRLARARLHVVMGEGERERECVREQREPPSA